MHVPIPSWPHRWKHAIVSMLLLLPMSLPCSASSTVTAAAETVMSAHREALFTSDAYVESIAKELHTPVAVVRDFVNAYSLYAVHGVLLVLADSVLHKFEVSEKERIHDGLESFFWLHRLFYWGVGAVRYLPEMPVAYLTHAVLYPLVLEASGYASWVLRVHLTHVKPSNNGWKSIFKFK